MSAKETIGDYYADTAYTPAKRQQWEAANPERDTIIGSRLSWNRRTQDNGMEEDYDFSHIQISEKEEKRCIDSGVKNGDIYRLLKMCYDNQAIMPPNYTALAKYMHVGMALSMGFFFLFSIGFCLIVLIGFYHWLIGGNDFEYFLSLLLESAKFSFPIITAALIFWKGGGYLKKKRPEVFLGMRKGPLWQANRQTGLFTIYDPRNAWETRLEAPFWEFDAFLQSSPDTQGSANYSLILYHPFQRIRQKLDAQFPPTKMPGELVAAWQFLQRYMDVSQPLPDVPGLEIHRHKDPTTAAADQQQGRDPRYWRDMDEASVKKIQEEKYRKNIRLR
ncbi:hypothetical protein [Halomonas sp. BC04]|uniref:hypothetical protein n=1 Tax=Halomonas sp. BC04 TaxID=1403540 RepID=UPI0003ED8629|nr:hypothetical protein [Halomonas sp. BC04]EWH00060.1 hypothetical protein Q427_21370 [Halomonas sp. BC04]